MLDFDSFENVRPMSKGKRIDLKDVEFRIKQSSPAVDSGEILHNVNDNYNGNAPDLGALEFGRSTPVYGPRKEILQLIQNGAMFPRTK